MARNTSVALSDHLSAFVDAQVADGRYGSASEVMRAGLRLLEAQEVQIARLRQALVEGENSGDAGLLDMAEVKRKARLMLDGNA